MSELHLSRNTIHFAEPLPLQSGAILSAYDLVIETYGKLNADKSNAVLGGTVPILCATMMTSCSLTFSVKSN